MSEEVITSISPHETVYLVFYKERLAINPINGFFNH